MRDGGRPDRERGGRELGEERELGGDCVDLDAVRESRRLRRVQTEAVVETPSAGRGAGPLTVLVAIRGQGEGEARQARERALRALTGFGEGVEVVLLPDLRGCLAQAELRPTDLILVASVVDEECEAFLRSRPGNGTPVVLLLRDASAQSILRAFRAGAADCIDANGPPEELGERIRSWATDPPRAIARAQRSFDRPLRDHAENILAHMNSALLVVDTEGRITFANPAAESILAARPGALRGRPLESWLVTSSGRPNLVERTLGEAKSFKGAETLARDANGATVPIGLSCSPLRDSEGRPKGAVAIFQDLSEIKHLQSQVVQSEKMASIGQLAAGVAHEINNPMGFIHANLSQLSEYVSDLQRVFEKVDGLRKSSAASSDEAVLASLEEFDVLAREIDLEFVLGDIGKALLESQEGSERIRHIVQDLRDFARTDGDGPSEADINQCIDSTANIAWTMMKHCVELEKDYGDLPPLRCFPMQLQQVFMNLLVNAYQAIQERYGDSGERGRIVVRTRPEGDGVCVQVRDTGAGIPKENLGRIFEPFFTTKPVGAGTGLGLANSYGIVRRHGGTMTAESEEGEGSCFELWLPLDPADAILEGSEPPVYGRAGLPEGSSEA